MSNKFVCPQCGGQLYYWTETVLERKYKVNSRTGKINKTCAKQQTYGLGNAIDNEGFTCDDCGWTLNTISLHSTGDYTAEQIKELLERYPKGEDDK